MHLDDPRIQQLLDRELDARDESLTRAHLESCAVCRERADEAQREATELAALLEALDTPTPRIDSAAIIARADALPRRHSRLADLRKAAAILLVVGLAGVVYAWPGSPVGRWVREAVRHVTPGPPRAQAPQAAGISIVPEERLVILFKLGASRGVGLASLSLTDGAEVEIHAPPGAAAYSYVPGRVEIEVRDLSAPFVVEVPRSAPRIEVRTDATSLFLKENARVTTSGSRGAGDRYTLRLESTGH